MIRASAILIALTPLCLPFCVRAQEQPNVVIHADARLAVLLRKTHTYVSPTLPETAKTEAAASKPVPPNAFIGPGGLIHRDQKVVYTGAGFRVQIYYGSDRAKAMSIKAEFMRHNPGVQTYITYSSPSFRVRVGNYRTRQEAMGMLREANSLFAPSMIVPDVVTISTF